jgi:hypothetical protein
VLKSATEHIGYPVMRLFESGLAILQALNRCRRSPAYQSGTDEVAKKPVPKAACWKEHIMGETVLEHISTFDDLDFNVFSNQAWDQLSRSHAIERATSSLI